MLRKIPSLKEIFTRTWFTVYPPDGWDPANSTYEGIRVREKNNARNTNIHNLFYDHLLKKEQKYPVPIILMASSFLALPNQLKRKENDPNSFNEQTWSNIAKNLIGWNDKTPIGWNLIKAPFIFIWNVLKIFKIAVNIASFFTELLPRFFAKACLAASENKENNIFLRGLAKVGNIIFEGIYFAGGAITSPIDNCGHAWNLGEKLIDKRKHPVLSRILSVGLVVLSLAITGTAAALCFPVAIQALSTAIVAQFPVIAHGIYTAINAFSALQIFSPVITAGFIGGFTLPVVGLMFNKAKSRLGNFIYRTAQQKRSAIENKEPSSSSNDTSSPNRSPISSTATFPFFSDSAEQQDTAPASTPTPTPTPTISERKDIGQPPPYYSKDITAQPPI